jgi:hypothetical protein
MRSGLIHAVSQKPDQPHALLIHPSNPSVPLMWKVLSDRLSDKIHFGFIKDDKGEAKRSIGIETEDAKVDGVKVVTFTVDGDARVYGGKLRLFSVVSLTGSDTGDGSNCDSWTVKVRSLVEPFQESRFWGCLRCISRGQSSLRNGLRNHRDQYPYCICSSRFHRKQGS